MNFITFFSILAAHSSALSPHLKIANDVYELTQEKSFASTYLESVDEALEVPQNPLTDSPLQAIKKIFDTPDQHFCEEEPDAFCSIFKDKRKSCRDIYLKEKYLLEKIGNISLGIINGITPETLLFLPDSHPELAILDMERKIAYIVIGLEHTITSQQVSLAISAALDELKEDSNKVYNAILPHLKNIRGVPTDLAELLNEDVLLKLREVKGGLSQKVSESLVGKSISLYMHHFLHNEIFKNANPEEILAKVQKEAIEEWRKGNLKIRDEKFFGIIANSIESTTPATGTLLLESNEVNWNDPNESESARIVKGHWGA